MTRPTHRPVTVTFAAFVAAIGGFWTLVDSGLLVVVGASYQSGLVVAVAALMIAFGLLRVFLAGALFQMYSWARPVGLLLFGVATALNVWWLVGTPGALGSVVGFVANGGAFLALLLRGDAFATSDGRADVSDRHATRIGWGSR